MKEYESNYEKVTQDWRKRFLDMDQEKLIERFALEHDAQWLYLGYLGQKLKISRASGEVLFEDDTKEKPGFNTVITAYNMFYYAKEHPVASGELVPFRKVKRVYPFERAYQKQILEPFTKRFSGCVDKLQTACEKLGGTRLPQGDAGYRIPVYPYFDIAVLFWDRDDEFEAQGNMLFDANITDFVHEENVVCIAADAAYYLTKAAEMEPLDVYSSLK